ncbi:ATP-binding protein [uncultured Microbacterium sp.]|uniref:sensor histidine kinase n=1 Tax=uncultured Microbacterium sp. TaxID=191216 RepID=UPI0026040BB7|nr:ATP-binding protein [uncultured Microbacterium sp.]
MATEAALEQAWSQIPSPGTAETAFERFTAKRMEWILAKVVAVGSALPGTQGLVAALGGIAQGVDVGYIALIAVVYVPLIGMLAACVFGRFVRMAAGIFAVVYVVALACWPFVVGTSGRDGGQPWIFFLVNVGVVAAVLAFRLWGQLIWAVAVPLIYGAVRLAESDFSAEFWTVNAFDVSFTLILGVVLLALGWMFRSVAAGVDDARGRAVSSYSAAAAAAAAEEERVELSALMHDSVLAALIAAERADSDRARELSVAMAREALTRLANADALSPEEGSDEPVSTVQMVAELRRVLSELGADAIVEDQGDPVSIPGRTARAIVLAARQAIGNALTHAQGRGLHVVVMSGAASGVTVVVSDTGEGFDLESIRDDRLGIRASIIARMAGVAGTARIDSDASGTTVWLKWERA